MRYLSLTATPPRRRLRRLRHYLAVGLRCGGALMYLLAGGPIWLGRQLMAIGSRLNGRAYWLELDR